MCIVKTLLTYKGFVFDDSQHNNVGKEACREKWSEKKNLDG